MSATWQAFITNQALDSSAQPLADNALYPLNHSFIAIQGIDAAKFLQGQLSCDIRLLNSGKAGLGSHNTPKGRMASSFRIMQTAADAYLLRLHASLLESASALLHKYIVFSKASLTRLENMAGIGLHGSKAASSLAKLLPSLPTEDYQQISHNDMLVVCTSSALQSYEIYAEANTLASLWQSLALEIKAFDDKQHFLLEHQQGLAFVQHATVEEFIPQMLNYQATPAVSFKKGCYTGQEIVARMQYLGKLKRHLYHCQCHAGELNIGDTLMLEAGQQGCGTVASVVAIGENLWDALVVLTDEGREASQLFTAKAAVTALNYLELPYTLEK